MLLLHSILRWVILLLLVVIILRSLSAGKRTFTSTDNNLGLLTLISCDLTFVVGLYLWFTGLYGFNALKNWGMKTAMTDKVQRFFIVEHFVGMLIAIILVHIGRSYAKKSIPDAAKHKKTLLFFGLAILVILISIPWPFRIAGAGRGWF